MENPASFDIWCKINDKATKAAAIWLMNIYPLSIIEAYKLVRDSVKEDGYTLVFVNVGWDDIPRLQQELPEFVQQGSDVITERSYTTSQCTGYCVEHKLWYVSRKCPVCEGNYASRVVDGMIVVVHRDGNKIDATTWDFSPYR